MRYSFVVACRDSGEYLQGFFSSLMGQIGSDGEILVACRRMDAKLHEMARTKDCLTVVSCDDADFERGQGFIYNRLAKNARGEYAVFCHPDILFPENFIHSLDRCVSTLRPEFINIRQHYVDGMEYGCNCLYYDAESGKIRVGRIWSGRGHAELPVLECSESCFAVASHVLVSNSFCEKYRSMLHDFELLGRQMLAGGMCVTLQDSVIAHYNTELHEIFPHEQHDTDLWIGRNHDLLARLLALRAVQGASGDGVIDSSVDSLRIFFDKDGKMRKSVPNFRVNGRFDGEVEDERNKLWLAHEKLGAAYEAVSAELEAVRRERDELWLAGETIRRERDELWMAGETIRRERDELWLAGETIRRERDELWMAHEELGSAYRQAVGVNEQLSCEIQTCRTSCDRLEAEKQGLAGENADLRDRLGKIQASATYRLARCIIWPARFVARGVMRRSDHDD